MNLHPESAKGAALAAGSLPLGRANSSGAAAATRADKKLSMPTPILKYFAHAHLPEQLQEVSKPIAELAARLDASLPDGPEKSAGLRKLLEAKDCFVRARLG